MKNALASHFLQGVEAGFGARLALAQSAKQFYRVSVSTPFDALNDGQFSHVNTVPVITKVGVTVPVNGAVAVQVSVPPPGTEILIVPVMRPSVTNSLASTPVNVPTRSPVFTQVPLTAVPFWVTEAETSGSLTGVTPATIENIPRQLPFTSIRAAEGPLDEELSPHAAIEQRLNVMSSVRM